MPHAVFDVVAEDPEVQHVAGDVKEPPCRNIEVKTVTHEEGRGHEPEVQREVVDRAPERQLEQEHEHVGHDERDGDDRRRARGNDVAEGIMKDVWSDSLQSTVPWGRNRASFRTEDRRPKTVDDDDLANTVKYRDRRQGADLLSMRECDDGPR